MSLTLKIIRLDPSVPLPTYATVGDAAFDLRTSKDITIAPSERVLIPTALKMEIPVGYVGLVWDRGGVSHKLGIRTLGGVVDAGYRGEIFVSVINLHTEPVSFKKGDKVAQMIIQAREHVEFVEATELSDSERGEGALGSSGK